MQGQSWPVTWVLGSELTPFATSAANILNIDLPFQFLAFFCKLALFYFSLEFQLGEAFGPGVPLSMVGKQLTCLGLY